MKKLYLLLAGFLVVGLEARNCDDLMSAYSQLSQNINQLEQDIIEIYRSAALQNYAGVDQIQILINEKELLRDQVEELLLAGGCNFQKPVNRKDDDDDEVFYDDEE